MSERKRPIGIIVLGHGSRRLEANKEVETIAQMLAQRQKNCLVQAAFAEFAEPNLEKAANILVQQRNHYRSAVFNGGQPFASRYTKSRRSTFRSLSSNSL